jgi:hypothetical protein
LVRCNLEQYILIKLSFEVIIHNDDVVVYPLIFLVVKDGDIFPLCFTLWPRICLVANMKTIMKKSKLVLTLAIS